MTKKKLLFIAALADISEAKIGEVNPIKNITDTDKMMVLVRMQKISEETRKILTKDMSEDVQTAFGEFFDETEASFSKLFNEAYYRNNKK